MGFGSGSLSRITYKSVRCLLFHGRRVARRRLVPAAQTSRSTLSAKTPIQVNEFDFRDLIVENGDFRVPCGRPAGEPETALAGGLEGVFLEMDLVLPIGQVEGGSDDGTISIGVEAAAFGVAVGGHNDAARENLAFRFPACAFDRSMQQYNRSEPHSRPFRRHFGDRRFRL